MALKAMMLRRSIENKKAQLEELRAKDAEFETREAEIEAAINEAASEEEETAVNEAVEKFDADKNVPGRSSVIATIRIAVKINSVTTRPSSTLLRVLRLVPIEKTTSFIQQCCENHQKIIIFFMIPCRFLILAHRFPNFKCFTKKN